MLDNEITDELYYEPLIKSSFANCLNLFETSDKILNQDLTKDLFLEKYGIPFDDMLEKQNDDLTKNAFYKHKITKKIYVHNYNYGWIKEPYTIETVLRDFNVTKELSDKFDKESMFQFEIIVLKKELNIELIKYFLYYLGKHRIYINNLYRHKIINYNDLFYKDRYKYRFKY